MSNQIGFGTDDDIPFETEPKTKTKEERERDLRGQAFEEGWKAGLQEALRKMRELTLFGSEGIDECFSAIEELIQDPQDGEDECDF